MTAEAIQKLIKEEVAKALSGRTPDPVKVMDFRRLATSPELRRAASRETVKNAKRGIYAA